MNFAQQQVVVVCRTQDDFLSAIETCNCMGWGWADGSPARYFAPITNSRPYSLVLDKLVVSYALYDDVQGLIDQGYVSTTADNFRQFSNELVAQGYTAPEPTTAWHAFDVRRDRDGIYDD